MPVQAHPTRTDRGFTLVELLIVIVILGVLAVVTVFAVRGITDRSEENACAVELDNLGKAQGLHRALNGTWADEATLVSSGTITSESTRFDVTATGDSYQIVPVGDCVGSSGVGGPVAPPPPPPPPTPPPPPPPAAGPVVMPSASFSWHGGVTAWRYGSDTNVADEIVVLGREQGRADWVAATDAGASSTRRVHFVDLDSLTVANLTQLLVDVNNNGDTALAVYAADDTTPLSGSPSANVHDHLAGVVGGFPSTTLYQLPPGGPGLQTLFTTET